MRDETQRSRRRPRRDEPRRVPGWLRWTGRTVFVLFVLWAAGQMYFGSRIWWRVPCQIFVNGRPAVEASVFRSGEGTLLVDLRHAPTHADVEGGGYLVQPYYNRVRALSGGYYRAYGPIAILDEMWMPSVEVSPENPILKIDPNISATGDQVSFTGLGADQVVIHGNLLLPWPGR